ncbi:MAG: hypothetical protein ACOYON_16395 [Fimbriimonas sp.]
MGEIKDWVSIFLGVIGGSLALIQYHKAQKWKRAEFVAEQMKLFDADPNVIAVKRILDYWKTAVTLHADGEQKLALVGTEEFVRAIRVLTETESNPTGEDLAVREAFDKFSEWLDRFAAYIESGLITRSDLAPYLSYYWNTLKMSGPQKRDQAILNFLSSYGYKRVIDQFLSSSPVRDRS